MLCLIWLSNCLGRAPMKMAAAYSSRWRALFFSNRQYMKMYNLTTLSFMKSRQQMVNLC